MTVRSWRNPAIAASGAERPLSAKSDVRAPRECQTFRPQGGVTERDERRHRDVVGKIVEIVLRLGEVVLLPPPLAAIRAVHHERDVAQRVLGDVSVLLAASLI